MAIKNYSDFFKKSSKSPGSVDDEEDTILPTTRPSISKATRKQIPTTRPSIKNSNNDEDDARAEAIKRRLRKGASIKPAGVRNRPVFKQRG